MLDRKVLIDGTVYGFHEVVGIRHDAAGSTVLTVRSHRTNPNFGPSAVAERTLSMPLDDTLTFALAEEAVAEREEYAAYSDPEETLLAEIAPTLTDEQAETVMHVFPEWSPYASYAKDDRVRYSDGFYKCLQAHDAQESWSPSAAPSLWTAIIDASVLPIGEYPLWRQPDSTNPYMEGDKVTYAGSVWVSTIDYNVWAPGVYGWDVDVDSMQEEDIIADWAQPDSTNPYSMGDLVKHVGHIWRSSIDGNVWEPGVYGWEIMGDVPEPEPEPTPEPEPEPEPTPEPDIPEWTQPDATNAYMTGDRVIYNGAVYESTIDNNVWSPDAYPAGWRYVSEVEE